MPIFAIFPVPSRWPLEPVSAAFFFLNDPPEGPLDGPLDGRLGFFGTAFEMASGHVSDWPSGRYRGVSERYRHVIGVATEEVEF